MWINRFRWSSSSLSSSTSSSSSSSSSHRHHHHRYHHRRMRRRKKNLKKDRQFTWIKSVRTGRERIHTQAQTDARVQSITHTSSPTLHGSVSSSSSSSSSRRGSINSSSVLVLNAFVVCLKLNGLDDLGEFVRLELFLKF